MDSIKNIFHIVDRIKSLRELRSDGEVAEILKMTKTALSNHKTRKTIPYEALSTFCDVENISLDWLLTGEGSMYREAERPTTIPEHETAEFPLDKNGEFVYIPVASGEISAGKGLVADNNFEVRLAFRKDWIVRKGNPRNMSLIRIAGDSMEPTLLSGDLVLVDHSRNYIAPQGGIYAIAIDDSIMVKRIQIMFPAKQLQIISDNPKYSSLNADPSEVTINGKIIWFAREMEK